MIVFFQFIFRNIYDVSYHEEAPVEFVDACCVLEEKVGNSVSVPIDKLVSFIIIKAVLMKHSLGPVLTHI